MDKDKLADALDGLPLGRWQYISSVGSTNDIAAEWIAQSAADFCLVVADEQTRGRGRAGRTWFTPPGAALAFSLTLLPQPEDNPDNLGMYAGLGALAVCAALQQSCGLAAEIKWPNDVLLDGKKVCGVLVEVQWRGEVPHALVLGIGLNIGAAAIPQAEGDLAFPASAVEVVLGRPVVREQILRDILVQLDGWRQKMHSPAFINAWQKSLAFIGEEVEIVAGEQVKSRGILQGLDHQGGLLLSDHGQETVIRSGEIHLRPLVDREQD
ncbi:MAG: biotin--[acetyl-CoA-carboxylase] ligase [Anaerolineae bacterium]|nr:biotin--[acetyl-CoA-carboxylase] ligase [Anaerolineae bacterium]